MDGAPSLTLSRLQLLGVGRTLQYTETLSHSNDHTRRHSDGGYDQGKQTTVALFWHQTCRCLCAKIEFRMKCIMGKFLKSSASFWNGGSQTHRLLPNVTFPDWFCISPFLCIRHLGSINNMGALTLAESQQEHSFKPGTSESVTYSARLVVSLFRPPDTARPPLDMQCQRISD